MNKKIENYIIKEMGINNIEDLEFYPNIENGISVIWYFREPITKKEYQVKYSIKDKKVISSWEM